MKSATQASGVSRACKHDKSKPRVSRDMRRCNKRRDFVRSDARPTRLVASPLANRMSQLDDSHELRFFFFLSDNEKTKHKNCKSLNPQKVSATR